jgi:hypothetical protein
MGGYLASRAHARAHAMWRAGYGQDPRVGARRGQARILAQDQNLLLIVEIGQGVALLRVRPTPPGARRSKPDRRRVTWTARSPLILSGDLPGAPRKGTARRGVGRFAFGGGYPDLRRV